MTLEQAIEAQCPVCGYYCLGNGGIGCIDKPSMLAKAKPRTVMLEISVAVAEDITSWAKGVGQSHAELGCAAIKALKELKS